MPQYLVRPDSSYTLSGIPRFTITQLFNIAKLYGVPETAVQNTSSLYETKKQAHEHFKNRQVLKIYLHLTNYLTPCP